MVVLYFQKPEVIKPKEKTITLNIKDIVTPPKPIPTPQPPILIPKAMPTPKPIIKKPIVKKPKIEKAPKKKIIKDNLKKFANKDKDENNVTKVIKKIKKPKKIKKIKKIKKVKKPRIKVMNNQVVKRYRKSRSKDSLANALMNSGRDMNLRRTIPKTSYVTRMIKSIYGKEFNRYTPQQKKFIRENLGDIHYITQKTLTINGYPDVAITTQQQGTNIVSFYIHPNGDISNLRLKKPIGYASLDQNTINVIRIAYKDYPRPKKKTKIMFYVTYTLY